MTYDIHLDVKFDPLAHIDVDAEAAAVQPWFNQTLTQVNDSVIRLGVIEELRTRGQTIPHNLPSGKTSLGWFPTTQGRRPGER